MQNQDWERVIQQVYAGELRAGAIDRATALASAQEYIKAVHEGWGSNILDIDYNSPDYGLLRNLEKNCYQFAGAKNYHNLRQLNDLLRDGDRVRSRNEFKKEARKLVEEWNGHHQDTEYNTALNSATNARKWQEFESRSEIMPLLQFKVVRDESLCPICMPFADVVRPINDVFWNYATPSLHFGDRCTIIQLPDDTTPITDEVPSDEGVPKMFRVNLAKQQLAFPPDHPYYNGLPKQFDKEALKLQRVDVRNYAKQHFAGKTFESPIGDVKIGMSGIKEMLDQPHDHYYEKNNAVKYIDELLKKSMYDSSSDDAKRTFKQFHYLETRIAENRSWLVIRETNNGELHLHSIVDKMRKK